MSDAQLAMLRQQFLLQQHQQRLLAAAAASGAFQPSSGLSPATFNPFMYLAAADPLLAAASLASGSLGGGGSVGANAMSHSTVRLDSPLNLSKPKPLHSYEQME